MPRVKVENVVTRLLKAINDHDEERCIKILNETRADVISNALRTLVKISHPKTKNFCGADSASVIAVAMMNFLSATTIKLMIDKMGGDVRTTDKRPLPILACHLAQQLFRDNPSATKVALWESYQSVVVKLILAMFSMTQRCANKEEGEQIFRDYLHATDEQSMGYCTLLHLAVQWGQVQVVNVLLRNKANINAETTDHLTPIMLATKNDHAHVVKALLEYKEIDLWVYSTNNKTHMTVFSHAHMNDAVTCFELLLNHLANAPLDSYRASFVVWLRQIAHDPHDLSSPFISRLVTFLLNHPINEANEYIVSLIVRSDDVELLQKYLHNKNPLELTFQIKIGAGLFTVDLLYLAVVLDAVKCLTWLLSLNLFNPHLPRASGLTPLGASVIDDHFNCTKCLLEIAKVDPNTPCCTSQISDGFTVSSYALVKKRAVEYLQLLLDYNADPNLAFIAVDASLLYVISANGYEAALAQVLLKNPRTILDKHSKEGIRPLHEALRHQRLDLVSLFLAHGASPNPLVRDAGSPLFIAVCSGNSECVDLLLDHPAFDINLPDQQRPYSLLNTCIFYDYFDIAIKLLKKDLRLLVTSGPEIAAPLVLAVTNGNYRFIRAVQSFIQEAITKNILSSEDLNQLAGLAYSFNDKLCAQELLNVGASPNLVISNNDDSLTLGEWLKPQAVVELTLTKPKISSAAAIPMPPSQPTAQTALAATKSAVPISYGSSEMPMSGRRHLKETFGYDDETITLLQKARRRDPNLFEIKTLPHVNSASWNNGALSTESEQIQEICGTSNCFLYIPTQHFAAGIIDNRLLTSFTNRRPKMDGKCIKKLDTQFPVQLTIDGQLYTTTITHELRLYGRKERLLLCPIPSDDNGATLYVAVKFLPSGLHETYDQRALQQSLKTTIKINTTAKHTEPTAADDYTPASTAAAAASAAAAMPARQMRTA